MKQSRKDTPTVLVIFGATGDLMARKIAPALAHLFNGRLLPSRLKVVGFSRRSYSDDDFRKDIAEKLTRHHDGGNRLNPGSFLSHFSYQQGLFEDKAAYRNLGAFLGRTDRQWQFCANKLFYLAVPPRSYETIFSNLAASGLTIPCGPGEGWTRVIVEKPFGKDLKTAQELDKLLAKLFQEEQIYRIDHYLAKGMLQNILAFRFSNNLLEQSWEKRYIEKIEVRLLEKIGVEERGAFYDGVGALRDVGQNHLLQMLALATMENPGQFKARPIRASRARVLENLKCPAEDDIGRATKRGQYAGYRQVPGVAADSATETYFRIETELNLERWQGTPIVLEGGKKMAGDRKEIVITFKHPEPCLCPTGQRHYQNRVIFALEPTEEIRMEFWAKKPGLTMRIEQRDFVLPFAKNGRAGRIEEYEKLLLDCIAGDQTLFVSTAEVQAMWRFIDPIAQGWQDNRTPLKIYKEHSLDLRP